MKITVPTSKAKTALSAAAAVISPKSLMPILANVLLRADKGSLAIYAANDALTVSMSIAAEVAQPGSVTLPGRRVASIFGELMGEATILEAPASGARIRLSSATSNFTINGISAAEFPSNSHVVQGVPTLKVKQSDLANALNEVSMAMSRDDSRPILQGVFFEWVDNLLTLVATDGRRLVRSTLTTETKGQASFIVPEKAISFLRGVIGEGAEVEICANTRAARFVVDPNPTGPYTGPITVTLKVIEGGFPAYRQAIPQALPISVSVRREELLDALGRAALVCSPKHSAVTLNVTKAGIRITAKTPDLGESDETVAISSMNGESVTIRFNPSFLMDNLNSLTFDEVCLQLRDSVSPLKIEVGDRYTGVIMPVRLE